MVANSKCPTTGRCIDELEYRLLKEIVRPDFAVIEDEDDRFIARQMYQKKMERNLCILAEIEKEKPKLYALIEINISEIINFTVHEKQVDSKSFREMLRLMGLGFLGSFRWDSSTSTQHFEMTGTVDVGNVESFKCRRIGCDGVIRTTCEVCPVSLKRWSPRGQNLI